MKLNTGLAVIFAGLFVFAAVAGVRLAGVRSSASSSTDGVAEEALGIAGVVNADPAPVLVELFTSEGCSSCPPADQLLSQLDKERSISGANIIALSQHVDYWNQLGWRDPYSSAQFSARQSSYADAFGRDGVYTPQMIVDGRLEFVGSNMKKAHEAITEAAQLPKAKIQISIAPSKNTTSGMMQLTVRIEDIPTITTGDTAEVLLVIAENDLTSSVARGENAGRNLRHTAVVRQLASIGNISETNGETVFTAAPFVNIAGNWRRDKLRAVVFVQERASRHVIGAAMTDAVH
ncbi:MAG: DUF1223 domain-containing protein [Pyrinomonadaceae bacterium]